MLCKGEEECKGGMAGQKEDVRETYDGRVKGQPREQTTKARLTLCTYQVQALGIDSKNVKRGGGVERV